MIQRSSRHLDGRESWLRRPRSKRSRTPGSPGLSNCGPTPAGPAVRLPCTSWSPRPLNARPRHPPKAPGKPHKNPTSPGPGPPPHKSPRTRRHSAAHPGTHAKIETKTSPEQAKRRRRRLSAVPVVGGQGQDRTVDLPLFRRTLIPTELPDLDGYPMSPHQYPAVPTGFEPATSTLTGWRALQAALQDLITSTVADAHPRGGLTQDAIPRARQTIPSGGWWLGPASRYAMTGWRRPLPLLPEEAPASRC